MLREITEMLQNLINEKFWGKLTIEIQAGQVILIRKEETLKPGYLGRNTYGTGR